MASSGNNKNISGLDFLKTASKYVRDGIVDYVNESMPTSTSAIKDAGNSLSEFKSTMKTTSSDIVSRTRELKNQVNMRNLMNWFMAKEDQYDVDLPDIGSEWDDGTNESDMEVAQISETKASANQISGAVIESIHKSVEANIQTTANIISALDSQSATIASGFKQTGETLNKILDVLTKNSAALIEIEAYKQSESEKMLSNGRFSISGLKDTIKNNSGSAGMMVSMVSAMMAAMSAGGGLKPDQLISMGINAGLSKFAPNIGKNLNALDDAVNDVLMGSLIRLGNSKNNGGIKGLLGSILGIDSTRREVSTSRDELKLKSTPFDTVTKEAITNAIPGYLRKILVALGGPDVTYDYRSRNFKTQQAIVKDFRNAATKHSTGTLYRANENIRKTLGDDDWTNMVYDLLVDYIGTQSGSNEANEIIDNLKDPKFVESLVMNELIGSNGKKYDKSNSKVFAKRMASLNDDIIYNSILNQASEINARRNASLENYVKNANAYGMDLSHITDDHSRDRDNIKENYRRNDISKPESSISEKVDSGKLTGVDYTNLALYEIYRRLDTGINVYQVGSSDTQNKPFSRWGSRHLKKPMRGNVAKDEPRSDESGQSFIKGSEGDYNNPLKNNVDENGNPEDLTKGERFKRWGVTRGRQLGGAILHGSPEEVKQVFADTIHDVSQVASDQFKKGVSKINDHFGNVGGYLKHKMFGSEYKYFDTNSEGKQVEVTIPKNEKGGMFGFVTDKVQGWFKTGTENAKNWFSEVSGYFDYPEKGEDGKKDNQTAAKRKKLIHASVGAMAGAGLLGGPVGIIMGAVAGNALGQIPNIGEKLKNSLFGKEKETGKPTGLINKAADAVITPIQYQFHKTMSFVGDKLKKNILGPLSDLGYVMKERISSGVQSVTSKIFGKIFDVGLKAAGGVAKVGGKIFEGILGAKATGVRAKVGAASAVFAGGMNFINNRLAGGTPGLRDDLDKRRKERNDLIEQNSKKFKGGIKEFRKNKWAASVEQDSISELAEYMKEGEPIQREISESNSEVAENTKQTVETLEEISDKITDLNKNSSKRSSKYDEDESLVAGTESIAALVGPNNKDDIASDSGNFASSVVGATTSTIMSGDKITDKEYNSATKVVDEASDDNPDKKSVGSRLKSLFRMQRENNEEEGEQKEGFFSKILGFLGGIGSFFGGLISSLPAIAGVIGALWVLLKNPQAVADIFNRLGKVASKALDWFGDEDPDQSPADVGVNTILGMADMNVDHAIDLAIPGRSINHVEKDGAGNAIVNSSATEAKEELLWKAPLRSQLLGIATPSTVVNGMRSNFYMGKAGIYEKMSNFSKEHLGGIGSKGLDKKVDKSLNKAADYDELANSSQNHNAASSIARGVGDIAVLQMMSGGSGFVTEKAFKLFGANDEVAGTAGDISEMVVAGGLTVNLMKSTATGKQSIVDKVLDGILKVFKWIAQKIGADKAFEKIGGDKIVKAFEKLGNGVVNAIKSKFDDLVVKKIQQLFAKWGVEVAASTITAGIAIAAGAIAGMASGLCSTEHLFGVLPGEADTTMKAIAGTLGTIIGALEWSPLGWVIVILDVIDAILIAIPAVEIPTPLFTIKIGQVGLKQTLARGIYALVADANDLTAKQEMAEAERQWYNETFDTNMNISTFNDFSNTTGFFDRIWNGNSSVQDDGHLWYDEAGALLTNGGMKKWFVGQENEYVHDEDGNVARRDDGSAVVNINRYGQEQKKDANWGDHVGDWFGDVAGALFGRKTYNIDDESGEAILDEDGNYTSNGRQVGLFENIGSFVSGNGWIGDEVTLQRREMTDEEKSVSSERLRNAMELRKSGKSISSLNDDSDVAKGALSPIMSGVLNAINTIGSDIGNVAEDAVIADTNGTDLKTNINGRDREITYGNVKDATKSLLDQSLGKVFSGLLDISDGVNEWEKDAPWNKDSNKSAKDWVVNTLNNSTGILGNSVVATLLTKFAVGGEGVGGPVSKDITMTAINDGGGGSSSSPEEPNETQEESTQSGGNPLINKNFRITSGFGVTAGRPHSGAHKGVDLVPSDGSGNAEVGSRFGGTILDVKRDVPDSVRAQKVNGSWQFPYNSNLSTGNMITIKTDEGMIVKNMHLKAGSIPTNIQPGQRINPGERIGTMGSTGWSTGNHLHYEFRDASNNPLDPTESLSGTSSWKTGADEATYDSSSIAPSSSSSYSTSSYTTTETSSEESGGWLSTLISKLKEVGSNFLGAITGGLVGSKSDSETESTTITGTYGSSGSYGSLDANCLTGNCNNEWITIVRDVKKQVAAQRPTYWGENGVQKYTSVTINGKTLNNVRPDCSGIVCAMLKFYGVMADNDNMNSSMMMANGAIKDKFDKANWPGWDKLVEGDILVSNSHVEVFAFNDGGRHYVYNGGSTSSLGSPGATQSGHNSYPVIWRCREEAKVMVLGEGATITADAKTIWDYLKGQNLSDYAVAGLMGNLYAESGLRTNNLQDSYESRLGNDDEYTAKVNSGEYTNFANDSAGYGLAQWTSSGRKAELYKRAQEMKRPINDPEVQLSHLMNELNSGYKSSVLGPISSARSVKEASDVVLHKFEAPKDQSSSVEAKRAGYAQSFYNDFAENGGSSIVDPMANTDGGSGGVGGPDTSMDTLESLLSFDGNGSISNSNYKKPTKKYNTYTSTGNTSSFGTTRPRTSSSDEISKDNVTVDNTEIINLLQDVLTELRTINGNTGTSNNLLKAIGDNGIADKDLRNQLSSFNGSTKTSSGNTTSYRKPNSTSNNRLVSSMVRP